MRSIALLRCDVCDYFRVVLSPRVSGRSFLFRTLDSPEPPCASPLTCDRPQVHHSTIVLLDMSLVTAHRHARTSDSGLQSSRQPNTRSSTTRTETTSACMHTVSATEGQMRSELPMCSLHESWCAMYIRCACTATKKTSIPRARVARPLTALRDPAAPEQYSI